MNEEIAAPTNLTVEPPYEFLRDANVVIPPLYGMCEEAEDEEALDELNTYAGIMHTPDQERLPCPRVEHHVCRLVEYLLLRPTHIVSIHLDDRFLSDLAGDCDIGRICLPMNTYESFRQACFGLPSLQSFTEDFDFEAEHGFTFHAADFGQCLWQEASMAQSLIELTLGPPLKFQTLAEVQQIVQCFRQLPQIAILGLWCNLTGLDTESRAIAQDLICRTITKWNHIESLCLYGVEVDILTFAEVVQKPRVYEIRINPWWTGGGDPHFCLKRLREAIVQAVSQAALEEVSDPSPLLFYINAFLLLSGGNLDRNKLSSVQALLQDYPSRQLNIYVKSCVLDREKEALYRQTGFRQFLDNPSDENCLQILGQNGDNLLGLFTVLRTYPSICKQAS